MKIFQLNKINFPENNDYEVVERKGIGHPDTLADGIAEAISISYSKYCLKHFGIVLRHNVDKVTVMGGLTRVDWKKAENVYPTRILVNGRMSASFNKKIIPLKEIQEKAIKDYLKKVLPNLDASRWIKIIYETTSYSRNPRWFNPMSVDDLPEYKKIFANDTSAVVGYWPLTTCEQLAIKTEGYFYDKSGKPRFDYLGQDIKVMIVRNKDTFDITLCIPFIASYIDSYKTYEKKLEHIKNDLINLVGKVLNKKQSFHIYLNTQDQKITDKSSVKGLYFMVNGSALDYGEEGVVGRGNNRRGIIPCFRPYTMEAAWGKNPVYHVGKVHGVIVDALAREIAENFKCKAEVWIITRMGDDFYSPHNIIVNSSKKIAKDKLSILIKKVLSRRNWTRKIVFGEILLPKTNNLNY